MFKRENCLFSYTSIYTHNMMAVILQNAPHILDCFMKQPAINECRCLLSRGISSLYLSEHVLFITLCTQGCLSTKDKMNTSVTWWVRFYSLYMRNQIFIWDPGVCKKFIPFARLNLNAFLVSWCNRKKLMFQVKHLFQFGIRIFIINNA